MNRQQLIDEIRRKKSFLCVGLDPDTAKMPANLKGNLFDFNKAIIDATAQYAVAYKPNLAFYEALGTKGYEMFELTVKYIQEKYPEIFIIADAKRGDIGNTSRMYAHSFFDVMNIDAVTVAPYMGEDSVTPFLGFDGKWVIVAINYSEDVKPVNFQLDNHEQKNWQMYRTSDISAESLAPVGSCDGTTQLAPRSITTFMQK